MTKVGVKPGACALACVIEVNRTEKYRVRVRVESPCKQITKLAEEIAEVDFMKVMKGAYGENDLFASARKCKLHQSCVVPTAILKAVEAEVGMAVKKDVVITFME